MDLHAAAAPGDLACGQSGSAQFFLPVRSQATVCRAADGILVDADAGGEEPGDEIVFLANPSGWSR